METERYGDCTKTGETNAIKAKKNMVCGWHFLLLLLLSPCHSPLASGHFLCGFTFGCISSIPKFDCFPPSSAIAIPFSPTRSFALLRPLFCLRFACQMSGQFRLADRSSVGIKMCRRILRGRMICNCAPIRCWDRSCAAVGVADPAKTKD